MINLTQISQGQKHRISEIEGDSVIKERLCELGFFPGEEVEIVQRLLWNGPLVVSIRGGFVALREGEAKCIRIQTP